MFHSIVGMHKYETEKFVNYKVHDVIKFGSGTCQDVAHKILKVNF